MMNGALGRGRDCEAASRSSLLSAYGEYMFGMVGRVTVMALDR